MENLARMYFTKLRNIKRRIADILSWLDKVIINYRIKKQWDTVLKKDFNGGYLIEAIQLKLIQMLNNWPEYKYSEYQTEKLRNLIEEAEELLLLLSKEENVSHIRSNDYLTKQKQFFRKLDSYLPDLFYERKPLCETKEHLPNC